MYINPCSIGINGENRQVFIYDGCEYSIFRPVCCVVLCMLSRNSSNETVVSKQ